MVEMNDNEYKKWIDFIHDNQDAKDIYYECHSTGIGTKFVAVAKYRFRTKKQDITDYGSW